MEFHIKIIGFLLMTLAFVHIVFPTYFNWKGELKSLSLVNRQMMTIHTFFIALTVFLMGLMCLTSATELTETELGNRISFGLGLFWFIRLIVQFIGYSPKLWKGKKFETSIHILLSLFWAYLSVVFFWTAIQ